MYFNETPHLSRIPIEYAMYYVCDIFGFKNKNKPDMWKFFCNKINISDKIVNYFNKIAADSRHGKFVDIELEEKNRINEIVFEIVERVSFLSENQDVKFNYIGLEDFI